MRTELIGLRLGKADGAVRETAMRYNASHQRGYRCFVGPIVETPDEITEETPRSFEGRSLSDAIAVYRTIVEPDGWRVLHAIARRDCWAKPDEFSQAVHQLTAGSERTRKIDGFAAADFAQVTTLEEQRANFEAWLQTLTPVRVGRVPRKRGHEHDPAGVEFGALAKAAGQYLANGHLDPKQVLDNVRSTNRPAVRGLNEE
jgi:hypothetical protein